MRKLLGVLFLSIVGLYLMGALLIMVLPFIIGFLLLVFGILFCIWIYEVLSNVK